MAVGRQSLGPYCCRSKAHGETPVASVTKMGGLHTWERKPQLSRAAGEWCILACLCSSCILSHLHTKCSNAKICLSVHCGDNEDLRVFSYSCSLFQHCKVMILGFALALGALPGGACADTPAYHACFHDTTLTIRLQKYQLRIPCSSIAA